MVYRPFWKLESCIGRSGDQDSCNILKFGPPERNTPAPARAGRSRPGPLGSSAYTTRTPWISTVLLHTAFRDRRDCPRGYAVDDHVHNGPQRCCWDRCPCRSARSSGPSSRAAGGLYAPDLVRGPRHPRSRRRVGKHRIPEWSFLRKTRRDLSETPGGIDRNTHVRRIPGRFYSTTQTLSWQ